MLRVYVAGAYSANNIIEGLDNMRRGMNLAVKVFQAGFAPFCPWLDHLFALLAPPPPVSFWYKYSLAWLEVSQAMIVQPVRAEASTGTIKEKERAAELDIPVFHKEDEDEALSDLIAWAGEKK